MEVYQIILILIPQAHGRYLSVPANVSLSFSLPGMKIHGSYCVQPRFQLVMLRGLNEHMLVVDILDDVRIVVLAVDLDDDGFDRGITLDQYALASRQSCRLRYAIYNHPYLLERVAWWLVCCGRGGISP